MNRKQSYDKSAKGKDSRSKAQILSEFLAEYAAEDKTNKNAAEAHGLAVKLAEAVKNPKDYQKYDEAALFVAFNSGVNPLTLALTKLSEQLEGASSLNNGLVMRNLERIGIQ